MNDRVAGPPPLPPIATSPQQSGGVPRACPGCSYRWALNAFLLAAVASGLAQLLAHIAPDSVAVALYLPVIMTGAVVHVVMLVATAYRSHGSLGSVVLWGLAATLCPPFGSILALLLLRPRCPHTCSNAQDVPR